MVAMRLVSFLCAWSGARALQYATFDDASASSVYGDAQRFGPAEALTQGHGYFCSAGASDEASFRVASRFLMACSCLYPVYARANLWACACFVFGSGGWNAGARMQSCAGSCALLWQVVTWTGLLSARRKVVGLRLNWAYSGSLSCERWLRAVVRRFVYDGACVRGGLRVRQAQANSRSSVPRTALISSCWKTGGNQRVRR